MSSPTYSNTDSDIGISSRYLSVSNSSSTSRDLNALSSRTSVANKLSNKYSTDIHHARCTSPWRLGSLAYLDKLGGDDYNSDHRREYRQECPYSSASTALSSSFSTPFRYSSLYKRRLPLCTVLSSHAQNDSVMMPTEVKVINQRKNDTNDKDD